MAPPWATEEGGALFRRLLSWQGRTAVALRLRSLQPLLPIDDVTVALHRRERVLVAVFQLLWRDHIHALSSRVRAPRVGASVALVVVRCLGGERGVEGHIRGVAPAVAARSVLAC